VPEALSTYRNGKGRARTRTRLDAPPPARGGCRVYRTQIAKSHFVFSSFFSGTSAVFSRAKADEEQNKQRKQLLSVAKDPLISLGYLGWLGLTVQQMVII